MRPLDAASDAPNLQDETSPHAVEQRRTALREAIARGLSVTELLGALADPDWRVRREAVEHVSADVVDEVIAALVTGLEDAQRVEFRNAVVAALRRVGSRALAKVGSAVRGLDADGRKLAVEVLGAAPDTFAVDHLCTLAAHDTDANVRVAALEALAQAALAGPASWEAAVAVIHQVIVDPEASDEQVLSGLLSLSRLSAPVPAGLLPRLDARSLLAEDAARVARWNADPASLQWLCTHAGVEEGLPLAALLSLGDRLARVESDVSQLPATLRERVSDEAIAHVAADMVPAAQLARAWTLLALGDRRASLGAGFGALVLDVEVPNAEAWLRAVCGRGGAEDAWEHVRANREAWTLDHHLLFLRTMAPAPAVVCEEILTRSLASPSAIDLADVEQLLPRLAEVWPPEAAPSQEAMRCLAPYLAETPAAIAGAATTLCLKGQAGALHLQVLEARVADLVRTRAATRTATEHSALARFVHDTDAVARQWALRQVAFTRARALLRDVAIATTDDCTDVALEAVSTLDALDAREALVAVAERGSEVWLRAEACKRLGIRDPAALLALAEGARRRDDLPDLVSAVRAMPAGFPPGHEWLIALLEHHAEACKIHALRALNEVRDARLESLVGRLLDHDSPRVRVSAAEFLHNGSSHARALLRTRLDRERDEAVVRALREALLAERTVPRRGEADA
jgi:hypothetical protein